MFSLLKSSGRLIVASAACLALASCAGSAGSSEGASEENSGAGFEFGATQEEVDEVIADLPSVKLTYQPAGISEAAPTAANALAFKEAIETRSGGKIEIDIAWGQSIAAGEEITDALQDGRLDIAHHPALYFPEEFPTIDAMSKITQYSTSAPLTGEAISVAMMAELAWNNEEHLNIIEEAGLVPLSPAVSTGDYWTACSEAGSSPEDWKGRQLRIAGTAQISIAEALGATPVSIDYLEVYEALQRGTADCLFTQAGTAGQSGVLEAAPHVFHFADNRATSSSTAMAVAGPSFNELPLAYQQIIFDADIDQLHGGVVSILDSALVVADQIESAGGGFATLDPESEEIMAEAQEELVDSLIADGRLPEDIREQMNASAEKWTDIAEELGYSDGGEWGDISEWYQEDSVDFRPLMERMFSEAALPHRPGN